MSYSTNRKKPIYDKESGVPPTLEQNNRMLKQARNIVEYSLSRSLKSYYELETKLKQRGITDEIINILLQEYVDKGYINDMDYAEQFVYSKTTYNKLAKKAISYKLKQKGISTEIIEKVLSEIADEDEENQAVTIATQRMKTNKNLSPQKRVEQVAGMLMRKGYSPSVAFKATKTALQEEEQLND